MDLVPHTLTFALMLSLAHSRFMQNLHHHSSPLQIQFNLADLQCHHSLIDVITLHS